MPKSRQWLTAPVLDDSGLVVWVLSGPFPSLGVRGKTGTLGSEIHHPRFFPDPIGGRVQLFWGQASKMALNPNNRDAQNLLEAASSGAAMSVKVVANIAANLIAFLAVLAFVNAALSWLGAMVDIQELSFQVQFWPPRLACQGGGPGQWVVGRHQRSQQPRSQQLPLSFASAHLLLHPAACGLLGGRGLGGLPSGCRAAGDQAVSERVCGLPGALPVQAAPARRGRGVARRQEAVDLRECPPPLPEAGA